MMQTKLYRWFLLMLFGFSFATVGHAADGELKVVINKIESDQGQLFLRLYDDPEKWLSDDFVREESVVVSDQLKDGVIVLNLSLPEGEYALTVFHDLDGDGEVKRNYMGMPAEPVVMSNNAPPMFGPPKYQAAKFTIGEALVVQELNLN